MTDAIRRDLLWFANAPLMETCTDDDPSIPAALLQALKTRSALLATNPDLPITPIWQQLTAARGRRLGKYAEILLLAILQNLLPDNEVFHSIQLRDQGRSYGEIDFLICFQGCWIHVELAVKFYAFCPGPNWTSATAHAWVGPRLIDDLGRKRQTLQRQTYGNMTHPATLGCLEKVTGTAIALDQVVNVSWMFGRLFMPWKNQGSWALPNFCAGDAETGWWMTQQDWVQTEPHVLLKKADWLSAALQGAGPEPVQLSSSNKLAEPVMLHVPGRGGPGFLVPDDWPMAAQARIGQSLKDEN